jgi:alkylhydroperoxidase/carboxymuconolactone decarboxylase family protein YurZ
MDDQLPSHAGRVADDYPDIWDAYTRLGEACSEAGPLAGHQARLVKIALAAGAGLEGGVHSHTRRALDEGLEPEAIRHVALLGVTTLGFPRAMAVMSWVDDILEEEG